MNDLNDIFVRYFNTINLKGEPFIDGIWIKSNKFYVFFAEESKVGKTFALVSKKYYLTIELTKDKNIRKSLDKISKIVDEFRSSQGLEVKKYQFWMPHCLVNNQTVDTKLIAESYGVSSELALEYLEQYDAVFSKLYNNRKKTYFGLPLFLTYEEAENYELKDNTKEYIKGLKVVKKSVS